MKNQKLTDAQLRKNPHVQTAAVELLAVNRKFAEFADTPDEYGEEAGQVISRCWSLLDLPSDSLKVTPTQQAALSDTVMEVILKLAGKMERALGDARFLSQCN